MTSKNSVRVQEISGTADADILQTHLGFRAPLFIAQVDPDRLCVIRRTEQTLLPTNEATLGNSGICHISDHESWITCGEGLLRLGKRKKDLNKVHFVRARASKIEP